MTFSSRTLTNLGAAASGANADITSTSALTRANGALDVTTNTGTLPPAVSGTVQRIAAADGAGARVLVESYGGSGNLTFRSSPGTVASPTAVSSGFSLGGISAFGYAATGYSSSSRARIALLAAEAWTDTSQGTRIQFLTTPIGGTATALALSLEPNGTVLPGSNNAQSFGASGQGWTLGWFTALNMAAGTAPTSSSDSTGATGEVRVVGNYVYWKTSSGWLRAAGATF